MKLKSENIRLENTVTHLRYLRTMKQLITLPTTEIFFDFECLTNKKIALMFVWRYNYKYLKIKGGLAL